jgi:hypothetical protein
MVEQVSEEEDAQLLLQKVGPQGTYPFEVFDGVG